MSSRSDFPARQAPAPAPPSGGPAAASTRLAPSLLGKLGETFATRLSVLQRSLSSLGPVTPSQQDTLRKVQAGIATLEDLGVRIQGIARMLSGGVPMPIERISLGRALRETLDAWSPASEVTGVDTPSIESCDVQLNAALLEHLLSLAIECALQTGPEVEITVDRQAQSAAPVLTIRANRPASPALDGGIDEIADLRWALLALLARATGLSPQRLMAGRVVTTVLAFPDVDPRPLQVATETKSDGLPRTTSASGRRVLLIEPREHVRLAAHDLMRQAGMRVDSAATVDQARDGLRDGVPDVVVTGIAVDDDAMAALLDEIRSAQLRLRVVQLVDDDNAFAFSVPESDLPAQVGRPNLASTLVPAVAQELDAAWAT